MPTDFRDGRTFPRRGRTPLGGFLWLARVFDKGRASVAGTIHDYIYPCPLDQGVFKHWGITDAEFDEAMRASKDDAALLAWIGSKVSMQRRDAANEWILREKSQSLDRQDREEGASGA